MERKAAEDVVASLGWLSRLPEAFRSSLLRRARLIEFDNGQPVYQMGDAVGGIFGVVSGGFGAEVATPYARPRLAHIVRAGGWFGEGPVLTNQSRMFTFRAIEPSRVLQVGRSVLNEMAGADASALRYLGALSMENVRLSLHVVSDLLLNPAERRIAAVLLRVCGATGPDPIPPPHVLRATQAELGELANASRDVVNRTLRRLETAGWLKRGYNDIAVVQKDELIAFAYAGAD